MTSSNSSNESYNPKKENSTNFNNHIIKPEDSTNKERLSLETSLKENKIVKESDDLYNPDDIVVKEIASKTDIEDKIKRQFFHYRNFYLSQMNDFCNKISQPHYRLSSQNFKDYKKIPKCMMHTSRKICNCKPDCIDSIWRDYKFDESCKLYDLENFHTDDNYVECINLKTGPLDLHVLHEYSSEEKFEFINNLANLCDNSTLYDLTKCKVYQLRDKCRNDLSCIEKDFNYNEKNNCINRGYNEQVKEFINILGIEIEDNSILTDGNSIRKLLSIKNEPFSSIENKEDVIKFRYNIFKSEIVMIPIACIAVICLYVMLLRKNLVNPKLKTCLFSGALILISLLLVSLIF